VLFTLSEDMERITSSKSIRAYVGQIGVKFSAIENFLLITEDFYKQFIKVDLSKQLLSLILGNKNNY
jgi:hypothetical protein